VALEVDALSEPASAATGLTQALTADAQDASAPLRRIRPLARAWTLALAQGPLLWWLFWWLLVFDFSAFRCVTM
jgi:ferric-dicitrate binding protein FerR (iron transport regulator)